jgi:hypothetical protein
MIHYKNPPLFAEVIFFKTEEEHERTTHKFEDFGKNTIRGNTDN